MLTERELGTVLAAIRFWQNHGPPRPNSMFDRLDSDEQDALDEIRTGSRRFDPLTADEIDDLCERLNTGEGATRTANASCPAIFFPACLGLLPGSKKVGSFPEPKWNAVILARGMRAMQRPAKNSSSWEWLNDVSIPELFSKSEEAPW